MYWIDIYFIWSLLIFEILVLYVNESIIEVEIRSIIEMGVFGFDIRYICMFKIEYSLEIF